MEFMPMRDLQRDQRTVLENLRRDGEVIITNNGQPTFLIIDLSDQDIFETVNEIRRFRAERNKPSISRSQQQLQAMKRFVANVQAIEDEPITDEDLADLEKNRASFNRRIDL